MNTLNQMTETIQNSITNMISKLKPMRHSNSMNDLQNSANLNQAHMRMQAPRNQYKHQQNPGHSFQLNQPPQQLRQAGIAQSQALQDRPYMMFVYSQKFQIQGQGEYEIKITNVINPYTMKATPLQPSLIDPMFMMTQGIGNSKKALGISQEQIPQIIMQQNNIQDRRLQTQQTEREHYTSRGRAQRFGDGFPTHGVKSGANTNRQLKNNHTPNRGGFGRNKLSGGAGVRMLACNSYYKKIVQSNQDKKTIQAINQGYNQNFGIHQQQQMIPVEQYSLEQKIQKRQQIAASLIKKWLNNQVRKTFQVIKKDSWTHFKHRQQQNMKKSVQLIKLIGLIQDKLKTHKFQSFSKIKEHQLSIIHEKSNAQDSHSSQGNSKNVSSIKGTSNPQDNHISRQPTTASQSFAVQQQPKISQAKQKAIKILAFHLDQKLLDHKLAFWLPFRAHNQKTNAYIQELQIDFGQKPFDRQQLEEELASRFNKIEIKKIDSAPIDSQNSQIDAQKTQGRKLFFNNMDETVEFTDPIKLMEKNLANVSAIQPFMIQHSRNEDTFIQELNCLNTNRSRLSKLSIDKQSKRTFNDSKEFSPLFKNDDQLYLSSPGGQNRPHNNLDNSSFLITEDDIKTIRIENNIGNLNKDIKKVNDQIEQIKHMLFTQNQIPMNPQVTSENNESWMDESVVSDFEVPPIGSAQILNPKKRQLVPVSKINKNFRTEQEMIEHYELKALDLADGDLNLYQQIQTPQARQQQNQYQGNYRFGNSNIKQQQQFHSNSGSKMQYNNNSANEIGYEEFKDQIGNLQIGVEGLQKQISQNARLSNRGRSDSLKKNIRKYEQNRKRNLNDSRENDFEGFDDEDDISVVKFDNIE
ncbi:UNKNOWN [Stylonychia lemnae]|uniref:Uncharacterized protein n=1 Tax=Stylonychia lemnae TaxID=5949 RepID=A0A078AT55_STYLE|nr:UNKNOWN [Stylonychia lemnae]|eukprot:CDW85369.1 UNKNOWN [Stylonychia lemnae]